jgi:trimeric autotransporter adhesin
MKANNFFSIAITAALLCGAFIHPAQAQNRVKESGSTANKIQGVAATQLTNLLAQASPNRRAGFSLMPSVSASFNASPFNLAPAASAGPNLPVIGSGIVGRLTKWTGFTSSNSTIGNSTIFEDKDGLVGIGTDSPTSRLTVAGVIQSSIGGFKFPDGSVQTTAGIANVTHNATLTGNGTAASPLGVAVPLILIGAPNELIGVITSTNNTVGGAAVLGNAQNGFGIRGISDNGVGVGGFSIDATGISGGSSEGIGIFGFSTHGDAIQGKSNEGFGVLGQSGSKAGVRGESQNDAGVSGKSQNAPGVRGEGMSGEGVAGSSTNNDGVVGLSFNSAGVRGISLGGDGVAALTSSSASSAAAIRGISSATPTGAIAGRFQGSVNIENFTVSGSTQPGDLIVAGKLQVTSGMKMFHIDHPLDPENKYLNHAAIESSEVLNVYSGNITTDGNGDAVVTLPDWFEALNNDFRYQLTVLGTFAQAIVAEKIKGNRFAIKTNAANVEVSWQVTGVRSDPTARKYKFEIEEEKPEAERGYYLNPDAFKQPEEKSIQWARDPEGLKLLRQRRQEIEQLRQQAKPNQR